ncbi:probable ubiquitin-like-specific protease 2B isoform X1 [Lotus japonicus]|uniref:probable ubiquitin-like-specific protease 2B isoform X1 n=1 Tax=Lotus japonicus TaxID=34305 RepID=UPI002588103D|nr:probable ubiquitin-like-specific protease 2B isoform X1 [Lotus japonicus]
MWSLPLFFLSLSRCGVLLFRSAVLRCAVVHRHHCRDDLGIDELKIAIVDYNWSLRHKQITSLNEKYKAMWSTLLDMDVDGDENLLPGPRCYFPNPL